VPASGPTTRPPSSPSKGRASIGPEGQLILPKLFRRATDYLGAVAGGFLSDLLVQANDTVRFQADLLDVVFVEK
jgi:hypothetical protein